MANEKRLVDVDNAISHYKALANIPWNETVSPVSWKEAFEAFIEYLDEAPTVDAVEVVHAEWVCVNESENVWMCTGDNGCGNEILLLEGTPSENGWHYCPNCGAKMDGGNEDA